MGAALALAALKTPAKFFSARGRLCAALLLFVVLLGCSSGAPREAARWRIGLGAVDMAMDAQGELLAVACARSNDVWVLGLKDGAMRHRIDALPRPRALVFHPEKAAYYVAEGLSSVAQVRLEDERVARRFKPRSKVGRLAYEPESGRIFGGHQGLPTVGVYRLRDMHLETSLAVGGELSDLVFSGRDAWMATRQADALVRVALADLSVKSAILAGPEPRDLELQAGTDRAFVACRGRRGEAAPLALPTRQPSPEVLSALQGVSPAAETEEAAEGGAESEPVDAPASEPSDRRWDGGGLAVFRLSDARRVDYIELPGGPVAVVAGSGQRVAVACEDGQLRIVDLKRRKVLHSLALGGRPAVMLRHPDGRHLLIALQDQKTVVKLLPGSGF